MAQAGDYRVQQAIERAAREPGRAVATFETFYARCLQSLEDVAPHLGQQTLASLREQIEEARRQFLDSLETAS